MCFKTREPCQQNLNGYQTKCSNLICSQKCQYLSLKSPGISVIYSSRIPFYRISGFVEKYRIYQSPALDTFTSHSKILLPPCDVSSGNRTLSTSHSGCRKGIQLKLMELSVFTNAVGSTSSMSIHSDPPARACCIRNS